MQSARIGQVVDDKYQLIDQIGSGGYGAVFRARQIDLGREVAIKFLHREFAEDENILARFEREARSLAGLRHRNIVACYAFGRWRNTVPYMICELIRGTSLRQRLQESKKLPWEEAVRIGGEVCQALSAAHAAGIIHRDIKPENILIDEEGVVKLADFGLASVANQRLTATGTIMGSVSYLSPEQIADEPSPSGDLYSLACVLYETVAGRPPFVAVTVEEMLLQHQKQRPQLASDYESEVPPAFADFLDRALEKSPKDRFVNADEFRRELQAVTADWQGEKKMRKRAQSRWYLSWLVRKNGTAAGNKQGKVFPKLALAISLLIILALPLCMWQRESLTRLILHIAYTALGKQRFNELAENVTASVSRDAERKFLYQEIAECEPECSMERLRYRYLAHRIDNGKPGSQSDSSLAARMNLLEIDKLAPSQIISAKDAELLVAMLRDDVQRLGGSRGLDWSLYGDVEGVVDHLLASANCESLDRANHTWLDFRFCRLLWSHGADDGDIPRIVITFLDSNRRAGSALLRDACFSGAQSLEISGKQQLLHDASKLRGDPSERAMVACTKNFLDGFIKAASENSFDKTDSRRLVTLSVSLTKKFGPNREKILKALISAFKHSGGEEEPACMLKALSQENPVPACAEDCRQALQEIRITPREIPRQ